MERVAFCTKEFPGRHSEDEIEPWLRQWSTGIAGSFKADGGGTCKNRLAHEPVRKATAMVGHCSHSVSNNDEKKVQAELEEMCTLLELIRRNDTRRASLHAMLARMLRLYKSMVEYFNRCARQRALFPTEWQVVQQVVSVLDEAAVSAAQIQGGRHGFVAQSINDFSVLHHSVTSPDQDIRCLDPWDDVKTSVATSELLTITRILLTVLAADMSDRHLGSATLEPERINLVLDPRFKPCCPNVCFNGGAALQVQVAVDVKEASEYFLGYTTAQSEGQGTATPSLSLSGGGGGAAGGGGGGGGSTAAGADAPAAPAAPVPQLTRIEKIRAAQNANISRMDTASSAVHETRQDAALQEYVRSTGRRQLYPTPTPPSLPQSTGSRGQSMGSTSWGTLSFLPAGRMLAW
eukprot:jgi/Undpi1/11651/HiC_scaffold_36.g13946.m1